MALACAILFAPGRVMTKSPLPVAPTALAAWQVGIGPSKTETTDAERRVTQCGLMTASGQSQPKLDVRSMSASL